MVVVVLVGALLSSSNDMASSDDTFRCSLLVGAAECCGGATAVATWPAKDGVVTEVGSTLVACLATGGGAIGWGGFKREGKGSDAEIPSTCASSCGRDSKLEGLSCLLEVSVGRIVDEACGFLPALSTAVCCVKWLCDVGLGPVGTTSFVEAGLV